MSIASRLLVPALLLPWGAGLALAGAQAAPASPGQVDAARSALARWVETQEILSRERKEWQQEKEILLSRIDVVKQEISRLEATLRETRGHDAEARKAEGDVAREIAAVKRITGDLEAQAGGLEEKVRALCRMLPDSLRERVRPLYERMPKGDGAAVTTSLAERFQNILGILNEVARINGEINVVSEIRPLSDGKPSEVRTIYVGLGQAYFVSAGDEAGIGHPASDGWTWQPADELAPRIHQVLEMLQNKSSPKFVPLPVEIR